MPNKIDNVSNCKSDNKYMVNVRIFDFNFYNKKEDVDENSDEDSTDIYQNGSSDDSCDNNKNFNHNKFVIQMFGINELGETFGVYVNDFEPLGTLLAIPVIPVIFQKWWENCSSNPPYLTRRGSGLR